MGIVLPLLAYAALVLIARRSGSGRREAALLGAAAFGALLALGTELMSIAHALTRWGVVTWWAAMCVGGTVACLRMPKWTIKRQSAPAESLAAFFAGATVIIALITGVTAWAAAPSTWDAMLYHMPRVVRWAQQGSLNFYPSNELQQLFQPPFAEYSILHSYLLTGGDHFACMVQWLGMIGAAVAASLVARELGGNANAQGFAAMVAITVPQGILQATGAKNDYYMAFWLMAFLAFLLAGLRDEEGQRRTVCAVAAGISLGLAVLTKGTAYIYAPGFALAAVPLLKKQARPALVKFAGTVAVCVLLLNVMHFSRNVAVFGSPLGPGSANGKNEFRFANETFSPAVLWGNFWRSAGLHLGTPSATLNQKTEGAITWLSGLLGAKADDPATTWPGSKFTVPAPSLREGAAANTVHLLIAALTLVLIFYRRRRTERALLWYGVAVLASAALFSLMLKWQPWHTRLHLPLFILCAPMIALFWRGLAGTACISTLVLLFAGPALLGNSARPLLYGDATVTFNRAIGVFADAPWVREEYSQIATRIKSSSCKTVAVDTQGSALGARLLYPLFALLDTPNTGIRVMEAGVSNETAKLQAGKTPEDQACVVVCLACVNAPAERTSAYRKFNSNPIQSGDSLVYGRADAGFVATGSGCRVSFANGWGVRESYGDDWFRWSPKGGDIVIDLGKPAKVSLRGMLSSIPVPNRVIFQLDGKPYQTVPVQQGMALNFDIDLPAGHHILSTVSEQPGKLIPPDTRVFALQIRNLKAQAGDNGACSIDSGDASAAAAIVSERSDLIINGLTQDQWVTPSGVEIRTADAQANVKAVVLTVEVPGVKGHLPLNVQVTTDGRRAQAFAITTPGRQELPLKLAGAGAHAISLMPAKFFVPQALGVNSDARRLAFRLLGATSEAVPAVSRK